MKLFHTADWHLGKLVHGVSMTEDQRYILQQFVEEIRKERPDVVVIAGDLYDRSVPPTEAIHLLNSILKTMIVDEQIPILAVAGNHDSATRLDFGSDLMKASGLHMIGHLEAQIEPVVLSDIYGEVHFYLVPFAEPSTVRHVFEDENIVTHQDAMKKIIESIEKTMDQTKRNVFVGHAFITKDGDKEENTSDSERRLTVGGTECITSHLFEPFCYTALGHLHQAHFVRNDRIRYAGSPLKYSESEVTHKKGFLIVELDEAGVPTIEKRELQPLHDMRVVEDSLETLKRHQPSKDYVYVKLTDEGYVKRVVEQVRTVYPNALHVERLAVYKEITAQTSAMGRVNMDDLELFELFYKEMIGKEASEGTKELYEEVLQQLLDQEREKQEVVQ